MSQVENKSNSDDFTNLPHAVYQKAVNEIAREHSLGDENKYEIVCCAGSAKGDNYLGSVYRIAIVDRKDKSIKLSMIAKLPSQNEARRELATTKIAFQREILFYEEIYPLFKQFQQEKNIDIDTVGFHEVPACYKILYRPHEGIFFEDLQVLNFKMFDRFKNVTKDHVVLVMKTIAKLHATFFCINDQYPVLTESYHDMEDFMILINQEKSLLDVWYSSQKKLAIEALKKYKNAENKMKIQKFLDTNLTEMVNELLGSRAAEPYATICHGDCWNNNMMFYNDENGKPIDLRLLDFQIIRYASPVLDILHYLFTTTTKELRDKHYDEFLSIYYENLSSFIKRLESDPEKLFPRKIFDEHLMKFGKYGLWISILLLPVVTCNPDLIPDMEELAEKIKNDNLDSVHINASEKYEKRMLEVFDDVCRLGYI